MKINYVPGLPLRLFPQTSRDPYVAFKNFTQPECDLVLMTGNCPDTDTLWNITNLEDFLSNKQDTFPSEYGMGGVIAASLHQRIPFPASGGRYCVHHGIGTHRSE